MRTVVSWVEKVVTKDNVAQCIWDLCFRPDGAQLIVAAGNRVLVYNAADGSLIQALKGHKDAVYCVGYSHDGKRFASGSADKNVIVWSSALEGILRYTHNDSIQSLCFNPLSYQLASCACSDFGLWHHDQKSVTKHKVSVRITCCSWTNDGQYLVLGLFNGVISIRTKTGEEKGKIERPGGELSPIWSLGCSPSKEEASDIIAVGDWSQKLGFHQLSGKLIGDNKLLGYDPCCVSWFPKGEYLLVGGSNNKCIMYAKDGSLIKELFTQESWIWACRAAPSSNAIAVGCEDGTVTLYNLTFNTVHSLYKDRYAFRETATEVIVHHLVTNQKIKIKCRDLVKDIAVFKNRLAIQLPNRVIVYEILSDESDDMKYKIREKINKSFTCNLIVVTSENIVLCQEKVIQSINFQGVKEREWLMDHTIKYIKIIGGPRGSEGLLVGLRNGEILKIFLDNPFPISVLKLSASIRCFDLNCTRTKLAVIDEQGKLLVYKLGKNELLFQEPHASSVAWNETNEDLLCYNSSDFLYVKAGEFPANKQKMQGFVVGFIGCRVFCLENTSVVRVDVSHSLSMYQYLERKQLPDAYQIACFGATYRDWGNIAETALEALDLKVAKQAFMRIRDYKFLGLIHQIEESQRHGENIQSLFAGDICAYQNKFADAAAYYRKANHDTRAMNMYSDLKLFEDAKEYMSSAEGDEKKILITKQAEWANNANDPKAAVEMFIAAGEYKKAIEIIRANGWSDTLIEVARKLDKADHDNLVLCAAYLRDLGEIAYAAECLLTIGDYRSVIRLHVEAKMWQEAFSLAEKYPQYKTDAYLLYAQWLAENDKFEDAQAAFQQAGLRSESVKVLEQLTDNAVTESRFDDAGYYYWKLSIICLDIAREDKQQSHIMMNKFDEFQRLAEMYYVYHNIQRYTDEPFMSHLPEGLFNMSRFLLHSVMQRTIPGISKVSILYTLARQSRNLGAYKLARHAYEKLQSYRIPIRFREAVDLGSITIRSKPFHDAEEVLPMCYRCSTTNPLLNSIGNQCINCKEKFVYSFVTFEILPLVEFQLEKGITDEEACKLIAFDPVRTKEVKKDGPERITNNANYQSLRLDDHYENHATTVEDVFTAKLMAAVDMDGDSNTHRPIYLDKESLKALPSTEVIILKWSAPLRYQYFKSIMPDVSITKCDSCHKLFHTEDYELLVLQKGCCPFCRYKETI